MCPSGSAHRHRALPRAWAPHCYLYNYKYRSRVPCTCLAPICVDLLYLTVRPHSNESLRVLLHPNCPHPYPSRPLSTSSVRTPCEIPRTSPCVQMPAPQSVLNLGVRAAPKSVPVCSPHQGWCRGVQGWLQVGYRLLTRVRYGFTDLRGKPAGRGRARDADLNESSLSYRRHAAPAGRPTAPTSKERQHARLPL